MVFACTGWNPPSLRRIVVEAAPPDEAGHTSASSNVHLPSVEGGLASEKSKERSWGGEPHRQPTLPPISTPRHTHAKGVRQGVAAEKQAEADSGEREEQEDTADSMHLVGARSEGRRRRRGAGVHRRGC